MIRKIVFLLLFVFLTGACTTNKAQMGAVIGTLGGAAVGGQVGKKKDRRKNAVIGAFIGGVVGYIIGNEMDKYDRQKLNQTFEKVSSDKTNKWVNPDTGNKYEVTPEPAFYENSRICRKAKIKAIIDGKEEIVETTACRNPEGIWEIVR